MNRTLNAVYEAAAKMREVLGIDPYPTQIKCAFELIKGKAVEMSTGEGKTVAIALAVPFMARQGKVYVVTVNSYLANRDWEQMKDYYAAMGLKSSANSRDTDKAAVYSADIIYTSASDLIFDYLYKEIGQLKIDMPLDWAVLDEIDFILIDSSNSSFSVSVPGEYEWIDVEEFKFAHEISQTLRGKRVGFSEFITGVDEESAHYIWAPHVRRVYITEKGYKFLSSIIGEDLSKDIRLIRLITKALEARLFYRRGRDYIVNDGRIVLINRYNGRLMPNSQLESELHSMIEIKEGVAVSPKPLRTYSMSYPMFFLKFTHLCGTSGTVVDSRTEFMKVYGMGVSRIKPYKDYCGHELQPLIFKSKMEKHKYILRLIKERENPAQPVLVISESDSEAYLIHRRLLKAGIESRLLTSGMEEEEKNVIAEAGRPGRITVTTNMCGRGVDIKPTQEAINAGGIFVIITSFSTSRRIDRQAAGRTARQGNPGKFIFLASLQDELFYFAKRQQIDALVSAMSEHRSVTRLIRKIQQRVQGNLEYSRIVRIAFDQVIEMYRIKYYRDLDILIDKMKNLKELDSIIEFAYNEPLENFYGGKEQLKKALVERLKQYSRFSGVIIKEIVRKVSFEKWITLKRIMEESKEDALFLIGVPLEEAFTKYVRECFKFYELLFKETVADVLGIVGSIERKENDVA